jgi:hypothetical protein
MVKKKKKKYSYAFYSLLYGIDQSWSFDDNHVDFYVYRKKNYKSLNGDHKISSVDVYEGGDCNLLDYS